MFLRSASAHEALVDSNTLKDGERRWTRCVRADYRSWSEVRRRCRHETASDRVSHVVVPAGGVINTVFSASCRATLKADEL